MTQTTPYYACLGIPGCNHPFDEECSCKCHQSGDIAPINNKATADKLYEISPDWSWTEELVTNYPDWEKRFDEEFGDCKLGATPERCIAHEKELKSFIQSVLDKTEKEAYDKGYAEGLQRKVEKEIQMGVHNPSQKGLSETGDSKKM